MEDFSGFDIHAWTVHFFDPCLAACSAAGLQRAGSSSSGSKWQRAALQRAASCGTSAHGAHAVVLQHMAGIAALSAAGPAGFLDPIYARTALHVDCSGEALSWQGQRS